MLSFAGLLGCTPPPPPIQFQSAELPFDDGLSPNWRLAPADAIELLETARLEVIFEKRTKRGVSGASRMDICFPDEEKSYCPDENDTLDTKKAKTLRVKWKRVTSALDAINNSARREIAAYQVQRLVLDPEDFVVPPSIARCLTAEELAKVEPPRDLEPTGHGISCELGVFSLWLQDVTLPDPLFDQQRFAEDPVYATYLANFNLVTYLIKHKDGRDGNFLIAQDRDRPITFSIDNGLSFSGIFYNWFVPNWKKIRVPALRRSSIERLRAVKASDLEALGVVAQFEIDDTGMVRPMPAGENLHPRHGARREDQLLQFGLTGSEIEDLEERIEDLLEKVDEGEIPLF